MEKDEEFCRRNLVLGALVRQALSKFDIIQDIFSLIDERRWRIAIATRLMSEEEQWKKMKNSVGEI